MKDRTKFVALAVVTVPLAWVALTGGSEVEQARPRPPASSAVPTSTAPTSTASTSTAPTSTAPTSTVSTSTASTSSEPAPSAAPAEAEVVPEGTGRLISVPGSTAPSGPGDVQRYTVSVEGGLGIDAGVFAAEVDRTLADPRSWGRTGRLAFQRVDSGPVDVKVVLASPALTDRMCRPLKTLGRLSCGNGTTAVLNSFRWLRGADAYTGRLPEYRQYVVNHEVGHTIGHGHEGCPGAGRLAPVMMQQTKGVGACLPSSWPFP